MYGGRESRMVTPMPAAFSAVTKLESLTASTRSAAVRPSPGTSCTSIEVDDELEIRMSARGTPVAEEMALARLVCTDAETDSMRRRVSTSERVKATTSAVTSPGWLGGGGEGGGGMVEAERAEEERVVVVRAVGGGGGAGSAAVAVAVKAAEARVAAATEAERAAGAKAGAMVGAAMVGAAKEGAARAGRRGRR